MINKRSFSGGVPGSPLDPRAQGCNLLIREGATLIQNAADVMELLCPIDPRAVRAPGTAFVAAPPADASDGERRAIAGLLGPVPVDELIRQSGLLPAVVWTVLLDWSSPAGWNALWAGG